MAKKSEFIGAFVCIFDKSLSEVLLLSRNWEKKKRQGKTWEGGIRWGNVGGSVEPGETPLQGCMREVKEETGLNLSPKDLVEVEVRRSPQGANLYTVHFYATSVNRNAKISLNDESTSYGWFKLESLPSGMFDSKEDLLKWRELLLTGPSS